METIDRMLAYRNRTLRTWPGKLLLGPTGRRLLQIMSIRCRVCGGELFYSQA